MDSFVEWGTSSNLNINLNIKELQRLQPLMIRRMILINIRCYEDEFLIVTKFIGPSQDLSIGLEETQNMLNLNMVM